MRELNGMQLILWLLIPWLSTRGDGSALTSVGAVAVVTLLTGGLRWAAERRMHGIPLHPLDDMLARAYDAPASVLALTAVSGRVAPTRVRLPGHPLTIAAILFALLSVVPLFTQGSAAERSTSVGLALTELALLWLLAMRIVFQQVSPRRTYRVPARLAVRIDGRPAMTVDVSPSGLGCEGRMEAVPTGSTVPIVIDLDDSSSVSATGSIVSRGRRTGEGPVGMVMHVASADRIGWAAQLLRCAALASDQPLHRKPSGRRTPSTRALPVRILERATAALMALVTAATMLALCLAIGGYRPLIVRSGSMRPTLQVGDVILVEDVRAEQLQPGDVVTVGDPKHRAGTLTHRVVSVVRGGEELVLTTRGDANTGNEAIEIAPETIVGRMVAHVPRLGKLVAWTAEPTVRVVAAVVGATTVTTLLARMRPRRRQHSHASAVANAPMTTASESDGPTPSTTGRRIMGP